MSFPSDLEGLNFNFCFAVSDFNMDATILYSTEIIALHSYVLHINYILGDKNFGLGFKCSVAGLATTVPNWQMR